MLKKYPEDKLHEEIAFIAYYFHWSYSDILNMEHAERKRWCNEITKINKKIGEDLSKQ